MKTRTWSLGIATLVAVIGVVAVLRGVWMPQGAIAQAPQSPRPVPVETAMAAKKKVPIQIEALGVVTPIASVAIKSRLETEIVKVHVGDGAMVKEGELLFTLDSRSIEAQIKQAEGALARSRAQLAGAERDLRRFTELVAKNATPQTNLDNAKTQADIFRAAIETDQALLENLRVQLSYAAIRAPISGRMGAVTMKAGNFVRPADTQPLATIIQTAPLYVTFPVAQRHLPDLREAIARGTASIEATMQGDTKAAKGQVTLIENTVDVQTGMATVRATMPNADDLLWPGALVNAKVTLRNEEVVTVPTVAVQVGQQGSFVYIVKDHAARIQPVKVARVVGAESVIETGLNGGETVVTDGQLLLTNGARVAPRERRQDGRPGA